jgi:uroporphyrin-III C-methyltransferase
MHMNERRHKGRVIFAGAGPGDPELLTLKALRYLRKADVVITDRLVSEEILKEYVSTEALILHAGKQAGREGSTPQVMINELMLEYAAQGKLVVRLKGGDVSIFSNIADELTCLNEHGISYEIIPGITAASGAAAYAGIPLTARGLSRAVRFLAFYQEKLLEESYWQELAGTTDTLVFYMSSGSVETIVEKLTRYRVSADCYISVIEQATTPMQSVRTFNIYDFQMSKSIGEPLSPSIIVIGKVAGLAKQFQWVRKNGHSGNYFKPLDKKARSHQRA